MTEIGASGARPHAHDPRRFDRAFGIGIALNLGYVAVEAYYGWRIDSLALLADAGTSTCAARSCTWRRTRWCRRESS